MKKKFKRINTQIKRNISVLGETIEITVEKLLNNDLENSIEDRDLVYNSDETDIVNPITNIRSDKFDLMIEEKTGEIEHVHKKSTKIEETKTEETKTEEIKTEE